MRNGKRGKKGLTASARVVRVRARQFAAAIAQLVRAQDCDSWGRGFESRWPPHFS